MHFPLDHEFVENCGLNDFGDLLTHPFRKCPPGRCNPDGAEQCSPCSSGVTASTPTGSRGRTLPRCKEVGRSPGSGSGRACSRWGGRHGLGVDGQGLDPGKGCRHRYLQVVCLKGEADWVKVVRGEWSGDRMGWDVAPLKNIRVGEAWAIGAGVAHRLLIYSQISIPRSPSLLRGSALCHLKKPEPLLHQRVPVSHGQLRAPALSQILFSLWC